MNKRFAEKQLDEAEKIVLEYISNSSVRTNKESAVLSQEDISKIGNYLTNKNQPIHDTVIEEQKGEDGSMSIRFDKEVRENRFSKFSKKRAFASEER